MSEHGSGAYSFDPETGVPETDVSASPPYEEQTIHDVAATATSNYNFELEVDIHQRQNGAGGGGGGKTQKKPGLSFEERARYLSARSEGVRQTAPATPPHSSPSPAQLPNSSALVSSQMAAPEENAVAPTASHPPRSENNTTRPVVQDPVLSQGFLVDNAMMARPPPSTSDPNDPWIAAGSLKPLGNEEVLLRCAGSLSDVFQAYLLVSYIMLTQRRIVIKQRSTLLGMHLYTVEASFLYENLRHITVQRVTNFKFLWGGIVALFIGISFFGLGALLWIYALLGIVLFCAGFFAIYWFFIFYNSNSIVMDFSKGDLVGSWVTSAGKGAFITKSLILHIDHCFEVMYGIYDQAKCVFANNNV